MNSFSIRTYYTLTKPGIIFGNLITCAGGFFLAPMEFNGWLFLSSLLGLGFIIGSGCVFNNIIDRIADSKMNRTKTRALATQTIPIAYASLFGLSLALIGSSILFQWTNLLSLKLALLGFFIYIIPYSLSKYYSTHSTLIGSIAGAIPPVVGYTAASNQFDLGALLLFAMLISWQMPHFLAIAIRHIEDYKAASIPILPIKKGIFATKFQMFIYVAAFLCIAPLLSVFHYTGALYSIVSILLGVAWLFLSIRGFFSDNDQLWAKQMFLYSLIVITALNLTIILGRIF